MNLLLLFLGVLAVLGLAALTFSEDLTAFLAAGFFGVLAFFGLEKRVLNSQTVRAEENPSLTMGGPAIDTHQALIHQLKLFKKPVSSLSLRHNPPS